MVKFKEHIKTLVFASNILLSYNRIFRYKISSRTERKELLVFSKSLIRIDQVILQNWQRRKKKCLQAFSGKSSFQVRYCKNNFGSKLIPTWSCLLKVMFSEGLMKFIKAFLKLRYKT